jgi:Flp pilus assembly protein TadD
MTIFGRPMFRASTRLLGLLLVLCTLGVAPVAADARDDARRQVKFGIEMAQHGLWREAIYRWKRAVEIDPTYAAAYNNLAIAYEQNGDLDKARTAYERALALQSGDTFITQNYELFREINDRTNRESIQ